MDPTPTQALSPARQHFIASWPQVLKPWSLPKAAAKIHAFLLSAPTPVTADDIVQELQLSSGTASTQLRDLIALGLVEKLRILGDRRHQYKAIADPASIFVALAEARRRQAFVAMDSMAPVITSIAGQEDLQWLNTVWQLQSLANVMNEWLGVCITKDPEWTVRYMQNAEANMPDS